MEIFGSLLSKILLNYNNLKDTVFANRIKPAKKIKITYKRMKGKKKEVTKKEVTKSSSSFLITLNQPERFDKLKEYISSSKHFQYAIAGREIAPTTGHKHIHVFVQYSRSTKLSIAKLEGAHVDKCYGTPQQNKKYVEKGEVIWEEGDIKKKGFPTIDEVRKMTKEDRDFLPFQYYNVVEKMNIREDSIMTGKEMEKQVKVYYISGPSGIGKTQFAKKLIGNRPFSLVKYENGFWMGIGDTEAALYDDWRDSHMKPSEFLNFVDYNKQIMNIKGGMKINNYRLIVITSIFRLDEIYQDEQGESRTQWKRRVHEIKLGVVYNDDRKKHLTYLFMILNDYIKLYIMNILKKYKKLDNT